MRLVMRPLWQPPGFWWRDRPRLAACLLAPLAAAYGFVAGRRLQQPGLRLKIPVICVGNFVVGGAGKTPVVIALAERLRAAGETPWILSRGYRSAAEYGPPLRVDPQRHHAADVGDEPLLLARAAPVLVSADRVQSAQMAVAQGASLLILDDGLQSPGLEKDLRLVVVDAEAGIGNGLVLPAGPLRAPLLPQLQFASAMLILGAGAQGRSLAALAEKHGVPILHGRLVMAPDDAMMLHGRRVVAFAGIGRPEKFFISLAEVGAEIVEKIAFPDHASYSATTIGELQRKAAAADAALVTTEKDFARFSPLMASLDPALPAPRPIAVKVQFAEPERLDALLKAAISKNSISPV